MGAINDKNGGLLHAGHDNILALLRKKGVSSEIICVLYSFGVDFFQFPFFW